MKTKRRCQNCTYRWVDGAPERWRCLRRAAATLHGVDLCSTHLGMALAYGHLYYDDPNGQAMEMTFPKQYALSEESE